MRVYFLLFLALYACNKPFLKNKLVVDYYSNGVPMAIGFNENVHKSGTWYEFKESGELHLILQYESGKIVGTVKEYNNGGLVGEHQFKNGVLEGTSISYLPSKGGIKYIESFVKGKPEGLNIYFDSVGVVREIIFNDSLIYSP
jgi:antitoxin component YwqK of YwqJK toxin-antitoxin module